MQFLSFIAAEIMPIYRGEEGFMPVKVKNKSFAVLL